MKVRELIYDIRVILKENTNDSVLSNRDIWSICWRFATTLISRQVNTKRYIYHLNIWKDIEVKFTEVPITEGTSLDIPVDCTIYKSINPLPKLVESPFGAIYRNITTFDKTTSYSLVDPHLFKTKKKITKNKGKFVFINNNHLYSTDKYPLILSGLFEDISFSLGKGCKIMDLEVPIPNDLISSILQMTPQQLSLFKQVPQDSITNLNPNN